MIHTFSIQDTNIVLDVNSGGIHVFDDAAFSILDGVCHIEAFRELEAKPDHLYEKYGKGVTDEILSEINVLIDKGLLFSEDALSDKPELYTQKKMGLKALCLHICHDCNLRCEYCFAGTGDFGGKRTMMTTEVGKKAIDVLISESGSRRNLEVDFFGGEPLMNFQTVKEIYEYAKDEEKKFDKNFRFTLTTNALLLNDEKIDFIKHNMHNVVLSIDGRKETHDRMRKRTDGSGSFDSVMDKIKKTIEVLNGRNYYVRGTFTRENKDFSKDVTYLADCGFKMISVEPVVAAKDSGFDIRERDLPEIFDEYIRLAQIYKQRINTDKEFKFFHFMIDLNNGPCIAKRVTGCGAGHEYMAVTPDGDLYPCHQFVGNEEFYQGNVFTGIENESIGTSFKRSNIYTKDECGDCWAKYYCSGGCAANAYQFNGDINKPYHIGCEMEKKRVEAAIWTNYR